MKFLVCIVAIWAVASATEEPKKEKRGLLGLGYGYGGYAEPLSLGHDAGIALSAPISAPILKSYAAPISLPAPSISYGPSISYSAPLLTKSYASPAISYSAPLLTKSYAAPAISYSAPLLTKSYAAPISYSTPLISKSYATPLISSPIIKSYAAPAIAAPISLGHDLGYSGLSLGYGKLYH